MTLFAGRASVAAGGGGGGGVFTSEDATSVAGTSLTVTFSTPTVDLSAGRAGFRYGINATAIPNGQWFDAAGAALNQSITVTYAALGAVATDVIYIDVGYSTTDPATTKTYSSDYGGTELQETLT